MTGSPTVVSLAGGALVGIVSLGTLRVEKTLDSLLAIFPSSSGSAALCERLAVAAVKVSLRRRGYNGGEPAHQLPRLLVYLLRENEINAQAPRVAALALMSLASSAKTTTALSGESPKSRVRVVGALGEIC